MIYNWNGWSTKEECRNVVSNDFIFWSVTSSTVLASHHLGGQDQKCTTQWQLAMQRVLLLSLLLVGLRPSSSQTNSQDGKPSGFQRVTGRMLPPYLGLFIYSLSGCCSEKRSWAISVLLISCWYNWVENEATLVSLNSAIWHLHILLISIRFIDTSIQDGCICWCKSNWVNVALWILQLQRFRHWRRIGRMYRKAGQDKLIPVPRGMEFPVLMGGWQKCECLINLSIEELHNSIRKLKLGPCRKLPSMNLQGTLSSTIDQLTALTYLWVLHCLVWEELNVANNKSSVPG